MPRITRRALVASMAATAAASFAKPGFTQAKFPTQPIRVVIPFPPGGTTDVVARVFGERMQEILGQPIVVENRAGGGGSIGADVVARSKPDGHTLLFHNITFSATTTVMQNEGRAPHDVQKDFQPVSVAVNVPVLLLAHPSVPAKNLKEFVEHARAKAKEGNPLLYGSTGPGSIMNFVGELLKSEANIDITHVPFRGAAPLVLDLVAGRLHFGGDQLSTSLERARSGALRGLAVMSGQRSKALPDVPTVGEMGFENLNIRGFNGFIAPANTPREIVDRLRAATLEAATDPKIVQRMNDMGAEPWGSTPEEFAEVLKTQVDQMRPLVKKLNIRTQ
jgi:tripartite-type tricarboxylate transporter receptor subunit TctC